MSDNVIFKIDSNVLKSFMAKSQLGLFGVSDKKKVQKPGSKGGKYWIDKRGNVIYGQRPSAKQVKKETEKLEKLKSSNNIKISDLPFPPQSSLSFKEEISNKHTSIAEDVKNLTNQELEDLQKVIKEKLESHSKKEVVELYYNNYKGTGKCWVAIVDPETKKIQSFLETESKQPRDNYSGVKTFSVPLVEGQVYLFNDTGSKSKDDRRYYQVKDNKLVKID